MTTVRQPIEQVDGWPSKRPEWLKARFFAGPNYVELKGLMRGNSLHTVCEEARCPNIGECWENRTATFMLLGDICTRHCGFCAVTAGRPGTVDLMEPMNVARAVQRLGLKHIVVTSVARDDLPDGGAAIFAATIRKIHEHNPGTSVEVLIPDFQGDREALQTVMQARPEILNHNVETVARLQSRVRSKARYERSLGVLEAAKEMYPEGMVKSGMMLGLGEAWDEIVQTLEDLKAHRCDIVTIGQYLRPSKHHLPIVRYVPPGEFAELKRIGLELGFKHVESGPLVRSSYHAHQQIAQATAEGKLTHDGAGAD